MPLLQPVPGGHADEGSSTVTGRPPMDTRSLWDPWQEMRRLQGEMEHLFTDMTPTWRWPLILTVRFPKTAAQEDARRIPIRT